MPITTPSIDLLGPLESFGTPISDESLRDLGLDRPFASLRLGAEIEPALRRPLLDVGAVRDRQDVFRDLEDPGTRNAVSALAEAVRQAAAHREATARVRQDALRLRFSLTAISAYVAAVDAAHVGLGPVRSPALRRLSARLAALAASDALADMRDRSRRSEEDWGGLRYGMLLQGGRIVVAPFDDEPDLAAEVEAAFGVFGPADAGATTGPRVRTGLLGEALGSVEEQVLDAVAAAEPDLFADLAALQRDHPDFVDPELLRFSEDLPFYVRFRELAEPLGAVGVAFALPVVDPGSREVDLRDVVDLALAARLAGDGGRPVGNHLLLGAGERVLVVSGPNQGGKSTAARLFGQVHHLAAIGCPVPAAAARLPLPDRVLPLFPREERLDSLAGGLGEEVQRVHALLGAATERSVLILNEVFASTSAADARVLLTEVVHRIEAIGALALCVTFLDEVAGLGGATVSLVAEVDPDDPARRTFRLSRRAADGRAYAHTLAERYRLTGEAIAGRLAGAGR